MQRNTGNNNNYSTKMLKNLTDPGKNDGYVPETIDEEDLISPKKKSTKFMYD